MAAPTCATSFAGPSRSSRAISEACRLAGTVRTGDGITEVRCSRRVFAARLQHRLRHLLHEQRDAVGALDDVAADVRRKRRVADDRSMIASMSCCAKPIDGQRRHMGPADPGRLEFGPERHDQQHPEAANPVHDPAEQLQGS